MEKEDERAGHIGFTGTQQGMTLRQKQQLNEILRDLYDKGNRWFHHGDCIGADAEAHDIATAIGYHILVHPPINPAATPIAEARRRFRDM